MSIDEHKMNRPILFLMLTFTAHLIADEKQPSSALVIEQGTTPGAPSNIEEAHRQLEIQFSKEELASIDAMIDEKEMIKYHMDFGLWMRNAWGLWTEGPLAKQMHELGFTHPDDMSGVILETFWCKRHNKGFRLDERAESLHPVLKHNVFRVDLEETKVADALDFFRERATAFLRETPGNEAANMTFLYKFDPKPSRGLVTFRAENIPLYEIMKDVLSKYGLDYAVVSIDSIAIIDRHDPR
jgi:hypothetical protein